MVLFGMYVNCSHRRRRNIRNEKKREEKKTSAKYIYNIYEISYGIGKQFWLHHTDAPASQPASVCLLACLPLKANKKMMQSKREHASKLLDKLEIAKYVDMVANMVRWCV